MECLLESQELWHWGGTIRLWKRVFHFRWMCI
jgi:hypothetical protein